VVIRARTLAEVCEQYGIQPPTRLGVCSWADVHAPHAGHVMDVLSMWARADLEVQRLLLPLMEADHALLARMFHSRSWTFLVDVIQTAAEARLDAESYDHVKRAVGSITKLRERRNIYAHHVTAWYFKLPDAMLFISSEYLAGVHGDIYTASNGPPSPRDEFYPEIDPRFVLLYDKSDIETDLNLAAHVLEVLLLLREYLSGPRNAGIPERLQDRYRSLEVTAVQFPPQTP